MKSRQNLLLLSTIFCLFLLPRFPRALAFTLNNNVEAVFDNHILRIDMASVPCSNISLSHQDLLDLAQRAVDQFWNSVPSSGLRLMSGGVVKVDEATWKSASLCDSADYSSSSGACHPNSVLDFEGGILLVCNQNTFDFASSSSVLAATLPQIRNHKIKGSIILINDRPDGIVVNPLRSLSKNQLLSMLAHEIGHGFGLGHSEVADSLMYFSLIPNRDHLGWDDIDGVTYLYPAGDHLGPVALGPSCGSIQDQQSPRHPSDFFLGLLLATALAFFGRRFRLLLSKVATSRGCRSKSP